MKSSMRNLIRPVSRAVALLALGAPLLSGLAGCDAPKQDDFQSQGGIAGDPEGVMRGSVVYLGPRPECDFEGDKPTRVRGRVILTLFQYDNPPPPQGRATSALNLLAISGDKLFAVDDCVAKDKKPDPTKTITRSVPFEWPTIKLLEDATDYQVRGFYDADEDMNPFFSVKRLPTQGDVVGGALVDVTAPQKGLARVSFPARKDALNGFVRPGVTVALGNYVWTELPAFQAGPKRSLNAESPLEIEIDFAMRAPKVPETVRNVWELSQFSLRSLKKSAVEKTFKEGGIQFDFTPENYAFYVQPVDIRTVKMGEADVAVADTQVDPHPLLGASLGVPWQTPIVLFIRRAATPEQTVFETQGGIPSVTLVGSVLPDETATKQTFVDSINIAVPPLAVVDLNPANSACRIPYAAPGNLTPTYEDRVAQCSDLPTGVFGINVLHGVAGGKRSVEKDETLSANGFTVAGGSLSGQAWSIPNELAEPVQVGDAALASQGLDGLFIVHDPSPNDTGDCKNASDPQLLLQEREIVYRGICKEGDEPILENAVGVDNVACLPSLCCDPIKHLCDVPLCPTIKVDGLTVRGSPTEVKPNADGIKTPDCIPFKMPDLCCK